MVRALEQFEGSAHDALAQTDDEEYEINGTDLDADEIVQALKVKVREVSVFGEPPISEADTKVQPFAEV